MYILARRRVSLAQRALCDVTAAPANLQYMFECERQTSTALLCLLLRQITERPLWLRLVCFASRGRNSPKLPDKLRIRFSPAPCSALLLLLDLDLPLDLPPDLILPDPTKRRANSWKLEPTYEAGPRLAAFGGRFA